MKKALPYIILAVAVLGVLAFATSKDTTAPLKGVAVGGEYALTQVTSADIGTSSIKSISGTLGSIVIASTTETGSISFYATSSSATSSANLVFTLPAGVSIGQYDFDVGFGGGILAEVGAGFNGNYMVTFR